MGESNLAKERKTMKKIQRYTLTLIATFASATILATPTFAWGPERTTYTNNDPAPEVTFNSITNNAAIGDERNFVRVAELGGDSIQYVDSLKIEPGKEYEVYIYYHNNAASNLNPSGKGIANGVKVSSAYPTVVKKDEEGMISGIISATDSNPPKVWDEAYVTTDYDEVTLRYKTGTAIIHNAGRVNGSVLSTDLFTEAGTYIGINTLDGRIPGCAEYSGYITYTLVAERTAASLEKQVSLDGENWSESVNAKPGDYVTYKVVFKNEGNTNLTNVIFKDTHDAGLALRSGTTTIYDVNNVSGKIIDDILDLSGYNTGDAAAGALVQVIYQAKVSEEETYCGKTLKNTITASYNSDQNLMNDANVFVVCEGTPEPEPTPDPEPDPEPLPEEIVETGPLEITMAVLVILAIIGAGFYFWRTRRTLKKVENKAAGKKSTTEKISDQKSAAEISTKNPSAPQNPTESKEKNAKNLNQKPDEHKK